MSRSYHNKNAQVYAKVPLKAHHAPKHHEYHDEEEMYDARRTALAQGFDEGDDFDFEAKLEELSDAEYAHFMSSISSVELR